MSKILYYLLHGGACNGRVNNVVDTWGRNENVVFYSDYEDVDRNIYKVSDGTDYWDLEEKHVKGIKFLKNNFQNYDWYFLCDDDTFVNTKKMNEFIQTCDEDTIYGFLINTWPNDPSLYYPSGGGGTLIHNKILHQLIDKIEMKGTRFADVTLGLNLLHENFKVSNCEYFHSEHPNHYGISYENVKDHITFHHIPSFDEMKKLNDLCN